LTECALGGLPIFSIIQVTESLTGRVEIDHLSKYTLAYKAHVAVYRKIKRVIDTIAAIELSPIIVVVIAGRRCTKVMWGCGGSSHQAAV
jgi:hypothetical protein